MSIQSTYHAVEMALYHERTYLDSVSLEKTIASKSLISSLEHLLERNNKKYEDLSFFAVNQGPGPFTTLRVVIATANGLSFASGIALFGINALQALIEEYPLQNPEHTPLALLNAFGNDIYFAYPTHAGELVYGYAPLDAFLAELTAQTSKKWYFMGNGAALYAEKIVHCLQDRAIFANPLAHTCSINTIAQMGYAQWQKKSPATHHLSPLYIKKPFIAV
ncbi:MAG TPA: tRNA (adenosine(37)-N6)-threonylcarbamoyltransferase complex dimerization subunit type 1 TsaB [Candidatus Bathyarchaeia archaeon]|nr:tRNA (adenosine(37)-N6)-threonylcarbamoyltransferase complex dimerization subunit type 1 TsaB [Candidatus Bathyarchaeia archaeon]